MAYVYKDPNEEKKIEEGPVPLSQAGTMIAGAPGSDLATSNQTGTPPAATPPTGTPQPQTSSRAPRFTNLSQYLTQNAPQTQQLTQRVGEFVQGKTQAAQQAVKQATDLFNKQATESTVTQNQALLKQIKETPHQVIQSPAQVAEAKRMREATYLGPRQLAELGTPYQGAAQKITEAERLAETLGSDTTRKDIFSTAGVANRATLGKNILNNLLLGSQVESFTPTIESIGQLRGTLTKAEQLAADKAVAAQKTTAESGRVFQSSLSSEAFLDQFLKQISEREGRAKAGKVAESKIAGIKGQLAKGPQAKLTKEQAALLKMTPEQYDTLTKNVASYKQEAANAELRRLQAIQSQQANKAIDKYYADKKARFPNQYMGYGGRGYDSFGGYEGFLSPPRLPNGNYLMLGGMGGTGGMGGDQRGGGWRVIQQVSPVEYAKSLGLSVPGFTAPSPNQYTTPYDNPVKAIPLSNPYAAEVASDVEQTALEQAKIAALTELLGVPVTRPLPPGTIEDVKPQTTFDILKALDAIDKLRKGVR